jgi:hypothetical protein
VNNEVSLSATEMFGFPGNDGQSIIN